MNTAPIFENSLIPLKKGKYHVELWPAVLEAYDAGKNKETVIGLLNYIDSSLLDKSGNADHTEFVIPNGSINIYMSLKDNMIRIKAPFLALPEKGTIPLLRQIAEINFYKLNLSQIHLEDNRMYFHFETPLELCEPYKIFDTLKEICSNADYHDDLFIEKFGAVRIDPIKAKDFTPEMKEKAWGLFQKYIDESLEYATYFEGKRTYNLAMDALFQMFCKIDYFIAPQGFVKVRIERLIEEMYAQGELSHIIAKSKKDIAEFKKIDRKLFDECLYIPDFLIPPKYRAELSTFQGQVQDNIFRWREEATHANYVGATMMCLSAILNFLYRNDIPLNLKQKITDAMLNSSGKPWKDASEVLLKAVGEIIAGTV